jgi:hypothetical protein
MQSTAAKLSALIAVTDWGYGAGYARAWPYRYGTYGVGSGAPSTYTEASNYTEGAMILDLLDTPTNKLVFRGTGTAVIGGPESNALTADALGRSRSREVAFNSSARRAYIEPMVGLRTTWTLCKNLLPRSGAMPAALGWWPTRTWTATSRPGSPGSSTETPTSTRSLVAMSRYRWCDEREINYDKRPPTTYD